ncbi:MAG: polyphenol oxidase family protein, partial [Syntrophomonadaceae bacterium]|nr:polyphenol oxidase family protein [Syntrophomonadaceae bacterium]
KCCFEISAELGYKVKEKFPDFYNIITPWKKGFLWDLPNTNRQALLKMGIREDHVIVSNLCTVCNSEDFFSYRRDKGKTGRMAAIIRLRY